MLYRDFETQAELDAQYNVSERAANYEEHKRLYAEESRAAREDLSHHLDVPFGPTVPERLDVFPADRADAPVLLFIHGGYWHSLTSKEFSFVARGPVERGVTTVVMNYALCPAVTIDEIVRQARAAVVWLAEHIDAYGGNSDRLYVAGHSAGGHLTAMTLITDWESDYGLESNPILGGCAISGLFDLAPFPYTWLQPQLQLTWNQVRHNSPIRHLPTEAPSLLVSYGENESAELRRQSEDFLSAWERAGLDGRSFPQPDRNHFTAIEGFLDAESPLCEAVLERMDA